MARDTPLRDRSTDIDRRVVSAVDGVAGEALAGVSDAVPRREERWYGLLLTRSYEAVARAPAPESAVEAAVAVELLREYARLRWVLLAEAEPGANGGHAESAASGAPGPAGDVTTALLRGDYLYSRAFSVLGDVDGAPSETCFETLAGVSERLAVTFDAVFAPSSPPHDGCSVVDEAAGALGRGAVVAGATLAGAGEPSRSRLGALGRSLGAARAMTVALDAPDRPDAVATIDFDERRLRERADDLLTDVGRGFASLPPAVDGDGLVAFAAATVDSALDARR